MTGAGFIAMVRDDRWTSVFIRGADEGQLLDVDADPAEERNFWKGPACAGELTRLKTK